MRSRRMLLFLLVVSITSAGWTAANTGGAPEHLAWAHRLIDGVTPETNAYNSHPTVVSWAGSDGATETRNRSVCSSLVAHLFMQAYGYRRADFKTWMGTTFPQAKDFHTAIESGHGFQRIDQVSQVRPGDIVAIRYPAGSHPTGHVLVVAAAPVSRSATAPLMPGTHQYELEIIDSSRTGHGPTDTRHYAKGRFHSGVGEGPLRLYVENGRIVGYSWSETKASEIYAPDKRNMVIGRLNGAVKPSHAKETVPESEEPDSDTEPPS
jgi:hypothetical protein